MYVYIVSSLSYSTSPGACTQIHGVFHCLAAANVCSRQAWSEKYPEPYCVNKSKPIDPDYVSPWHVPDDSVDKECRKGMERGAEAVFNYYKGEEGGVNISYRTRTGGDEVNVYRAQMADWPLEREGDVVEEEKKSIGTW